MESLDLFTLEAIVRAICPQCTPDHELTERVCLSGCYPLPCGDLGSEHERIASLAALCLTSRQISAVATPHLYHRPTCSPWWGLARTLLARPDLASRVKHLCTRGWTGSGTIVESSLGELQSYWERQAPGGFEDADEIAHILNVRMNYVVLLVSSLCPNLEELDAVIDYEDVAELQEPVALERLRTIALSYEDTEFGLGVETLSPVIRAAPNIETLMGWQVGTEGHTADLANLKHLYLDNSYVSADGLRELLSSCPRLESFRYVSGDATVGDQHFEPDEAQRTIVEFVPRLKSLHLNLDEKLFLHHPITESPLMTDLTPLTELESLTLDTRCVQPNKSPHVTGGPEPPDEAFAVRDSALVDLLPASIREFRVFRARAGPDLARLVQALSTLAKAAPGRFPKLRTVVVAGAGAEGIEVLRRDFESSGIKLLTQTGLSSILDE